jgi:phage tail-like protein
MDANGSHYQLWFGLQDWARGVNAAGNGFRKETLDWPSSPTQHLPAANLPTVNLLAVNPNNPDRPEDGLAWDRERHALTLRPRVFRFNPAKADRPVALEQRRGAAADRYGNVYWIAASGQEVRVRSVGTGQSSHFWSASDASSNQENKFGGFNPNTDQTEQPQGYAGLTVTQDHQLVVGTLEPAGLLVFDLFAGGAPRHLRWPNALDFVPIDFAARPGGGLWVLEAFEAQARVWILDCAFRLLQTAPAQPLPEVFQGSTESPRQTDAIIQNGFELNLPGDAQAIAIQDLSALDSDTCLVLVRATDGRSSLYRLNSGTVAEPIALEVPGIPLKAHDFALVPGKVQPEALTGDLELAQIFVADQQGNQAFAYRVLEVVAGEQAGRLRLDLIETFYPMRHFGGLALLSAPPIQGEQSTGCEPAAGQWRVLYDFADTWLELIEQRRPQYAQSGTLITPISLEVAGRTYPTLDAKTPDCVWHRLILEGCMPSETGVQVFSRAANDLNQLERLDWQPEPDPIRRQSGSELPFSRNASDANGVWELLFQRATGRYLQLKLVVTGNGRVTPRIKALRIYHPRFSYAQYLPAAYGEDRTSAHLIERFLANPEGMLTALEDRIANVQTLFDPRSAPSEALEWLAAWFGVALDPRWGEAKRRLFVAHSLEFFRLRGTIAGLQLVLRLSFEDCVDPEMFQTPQGRMPVNNGDVRIIERFRTRRTPGLLLGDASESTRDASSLTGASRAASSTQWRPGQGAQALHERYRKRLVENGLGTTLTGFSRGIDLSKLFGQLRPLLPPQWVKTNFPIRDPGGNLWRAFCLETIGFVPAARNSDAAAFGDFLERRYRSIKTLNQAHGSSWAAFTDVPLPETLPLNPVTLEDWYVFESVVIASRNTAHRFTVLLPVRADEANQESALRSRLELARRVIDLHKPAHTVFEVKFFWAMFRLGEVRLGFDTVLDRGGRNPALMPAMVLGQGHLLEGVLRGRPPQNQPHRQVLGRDRLGQ